MHPPTQATLLAQSDLDRELAASRLRVDDLLEQVRSFTVLAHDAPWIHLDDLLADLRAAATTVAALEGLQDRTVT